jgi:hypothetical protein
VVACIKQLHENIQSIFDVEGQGKTNNAMTPWIGDNMALLLKQYKNILLFNTLTGLRSDEAQKALHLLKSNGFKYVEKERMMLKHYQFPNLFIRKTKNAYISIVNEDILNVCQDTPNLDTIIIHFERGCPSLMVLK